MIDFRYHIVSLISVFLALAVGIILGAGPLKESIGNSLTGQVEGLRAEKEAMRADLDAAKVDLAETDLYLETAAPSLLEGVLPGRRVAVVQLGPVDDALYTAVEKQILAAGATVSFRTQVTSEWTDPDKADSRQAYASNLAEFLGDAASTGGFDAVLAQSLVAATTSADPTNPDVFSADATQLREILVTGNLIETPGVATAPADLVVVLDPTLLPAEAEADELVKVRAAATVIELKLVAAAQAGSRGAVVAGTDVVPGGIVAAVRADQNLASTTTTVTGLDRVTGQISIPLALAAREAGTVGQYGVGPDATAPMPPVVVLEPVERTASGDATGTEEGDPDGTADADGQGDGETTEDGAAG